MSLRCKDSSELHEWVGSLERAMGELKLERDRKRSYKQSLVSAPALFFDVNQSSELSPGSGAIVNVNVNVGWICTRRHIRYIFNECTYMYYEQSLLPQTGNVRRAHAMRMSLHALKKGGAPGAGTPRQAVASIVEENTGTIDEDETAIAGKGG